MKRWERLLDILLVMAAVTFGGLFGHNVIGSQAGRAEAEITQTQCQATQQGNCVAGPSCYDVDGSWISTCVGGPHNGSCCSNA